MSINKDDDGEKKEAVEDFSLKKLTTDE